MGKERQRDAESGREERQKVAERVTHGNERKREAGSGREFGAWGTVALRERERGR